MLLCQSRVLKLLQESAYFRLLNGIILINCLVKVEKELEIEK